MMALLLATSVDVMAEASVRCDARLCRAIISGAIVPEDVKTLSRGLATMAATYPRRSLAFYLNSSGGDVRSALQLGRLLRMHENAMTMVLPDNICASACVLVLAGGTSRVIGGKVIIHRPYSTTTLARSNAEIRSERDLLKKEILSFLDEMNVSSLLFEAMDAIPPDQARLLTESELELFKLSGTDPVLQEKQDAFWAAKAGLSRQEMLHRRNQCYALDGLDAQNKCIRVLFKSDSGAK